MSTKNGRKPPQNRTKSGRFKKGQSGNPGGRPKDTESPTRWLREFLTWSPVQSADYLKVYADEFKKYGKQDAPNVAIAAARAVLSLMSDPDPKLWALILDRMDGKVAQPIEWREEARRAGFDPDDIYSKLFGVAVAVLDGARDGGGDSGSPPSAGE